MSWLLVTISFYFILAVVFLVDKYLLTGSIANPKVYTFYVGILGILATILIPFVNFSIPALPQIALALISGAVYIFALFWFYKALSLFEASRVVPAISGLVPLFTFLLVYIFSFGKDVLPLSGILAFGFLIFGSVMMVAEKQKFINLASLKISVICAFFLSLSFVLLKYVYLGQPFWSGLIWTKIGGFLMALCFLIFTKEVKQQIFQKEAGFKGKTIGIFIANQSAGAGAGILQNWAIALAPLAYVAVINALQGIQYAFLLVFTILLSLKFPQILKEQISGKIILQKILAILLISAGLVLIAL